MATFYLPSGSSDNSSGYTTENSKVNYRIRLVEGSFNSSKRSKSVTVYVELWRTNTGYTTYGAGTTYCKFDGTEYSSYQDGSPALNITYNSNTIHFEDTFTAYYDDDGSCTVNVKAKVDLPTPGVTSSYQGGNIALTKEAAKTYTVTFDTNGGTRTGGGKLTQTISHGSSASAPTVTRAGYTFAGWDRSYSSITANTTITAKWTAIEYTLSVDPNGGYRASDNSTSIITVTKNYQETSIVRERKRTNYILTGYTLTNTSSGSKQNVGGATFTFDDTTKTGTFTQGTVDCTLTANWVLDAYTITYMANGGSGGPSAQTIIIGEAGNISEIVPIRAGYEFLGWSVTVGSESANYSPGDSFTPVSNMTLYAVWSPYTYKVSFDLNGGYGSVPNTITLNTDEIGIIGTETPLSINSRIFECWSTTADGSGDLYWPGNEISLIASSDHDFILYAMYYCADMYLNSNSTIEAVEFIKDTSLTTPEFYKTGIIKAKNFVKHDDEIMFISGVVYAKNFIKKTKQLLVGQSEPVYIGTVITDIYDNILVDANGYVLVEG